MKDITIMFPGNALKVCEILLFGYHLQDSRWLYDGEVYLLDSEYFTQECFDDLNYLQERLLQDV